MEFLIEQSGERLDKHLAARIKTFSRAEWQKFIKNGAVRINGRIVTKTGAALRAHDRLTIDEGKIADRSKMLRIEPDTSIPLTIVYEDADIVVINKPAGLLVHPTFTQHRHTLVNALVARYPEIVAVGENPLRPGIVHRLDKNTSGLIVVAKNQAAFLCIKEQFLNRKIIKKYLALTERVPKERNGIILYNIRPAKNNRLKKVAVKSFDKFDKRTVNPLKEKKSVRAAETHYSVKEIFDERFALLDVMPKTGRTHQIRVHLAAIGAPIVGDTLYGGKKEVANELELKRQFLHAYYLKLTTPSGKTIAFEIGLPEDLQKALQRITKNKSPH